MPNNYAVIFDLDGVISDSQILHSRIESELLWQLYHITYTPTDLSKRFSGVNDLQMFQEIFAENNLKAISPDEILAQKNQRLANIKPVEIIAISGATKLISQIAEFYPLAIASGSSHKFITQVTEALNISHYFSAIVSSEDVGSGKPAPDIFLLAASKLNVRPENCLVLEDGINGMLAAAAANMKCIAYTASLGEDYDLPNSITLAVNSLNDLSVELIARILKN